MQDKQKIEEQIAALEAEMADPGFWQNKDLAQEKVQEFNRLKQELAGVGKYDKGDAVMTIFAGAGGGLRGLAAMLLAMYRKYAENTIGFFFVDIRIHAYRTTLASGQGLGLLKRRFRAHLTFQRQEFASYLFCFGGSYSSFCQNRRNKNSGRRIESGVRAVQWAGWTEC